MRNEIKTYEDLEGENQTLTIIVYCAVVCGAMGWLLFIHQILK